MTTTLARPVLTIAVPTYNRQKYLVELLPALIAQVEQEEPGRVEILIIDNASTDATADLIASQYTAKVRYQRNGTNIGADRNFLECIKAAHGNYVWLFGDDEVLNPGGVHRVLQALKETPDLLIAESNFVQSMQFDSYRDLLIHVRERDPIFPVHHTLITRNVFPREAFDLDAAEENILTNYGHMYGMLEHLKRARKVIVFSAQDSAFHVRDLRAECEDSLSDLENKLIEFNCRLSDALEYPELRTNIWLFYKARPLYKLRNSRKINRLFSMFRKRSVPY